MKLEGDNRIVAIDFGGYSFLPPSFFAFALRPGAHSSFAPHIAKILNYPQSTEVVALVVASGAMVPFGTNNIGQQLDPLALFSFLASLPFTMIPRSMCCTGLPKELRSRLHQ